MVDQQKKQAWREFWLKNEKDPQSFTLFPTLISFLPCKGYKCKECPIIWPGVGMCSYIVRPVKSNWNGPSIKRGLLAEYNQAIKSGDLEQASKIARQIADLPWREECSNQKK